MSDLDSAIAFAATAHAGQRRKYAPLVPYIVHPLEVMEIVSTVDDVSTEMLIASVLHDVLEDTVVTRGDLLRRFGAAATLLVEELTEVKREGNRKLRKELEAIRLSTVSPQAQTIKYADLISNTKSIVRHDPSFAKVYLEEKTNLLGQMRDGDNRLRLKAQRTLVVGKARLGLAELLAERYEPAP